MRPHLYILAISVAFLISFSANTQNPEDFNKIYTKTYLEIAPHDIDRALAIADSLHTSSESPLFRAKSLMLSATLYQQKNELIKAIELAEKANDVIDPTNDYNWKVRIYGFLATQYRFVKLYSKSKAYSQKALAMIPKIPDPVVANSTTGLMKQELAYYDMAMKNYKSSIQHIAESQKHFNEVAQNRDFLTAHNEQLLGLNYYYLNNYEKSLAHYYKGRALLNKMPDNFITCLIYNGIASVFIEKGELIPAKKYVDSALKIANESQYQQLKIEVYKTSQNYYAKTKNQAKLEDARQKHDTITEEMLTNTATFLDSISLKLEKSQQAVEVKSKMKDNYIIAVAVLLLCGIVFFVFYRKKQKEQFGKFKLALEQAEQRARSHKAPKTDSDEALTDISSGHSELNRQPEEAGIEAVNEENSLIPEETRQRILNSLEEFECSNLFTSGNMSLSFLSAHLNTNSKYLSYVIKKYRGKDFNSYINELRIDYVIDKLRSNPEWRQYKISALAQRGGFSSHSKFATIFKANTGLSPSVFIQYLNDEGMVGKPEVVR